MEIAAYTSYYLGSGFLVAALIQAAFAAWRRRDTQRLDAFVFFLLLGIAAFLRGGAPRTVFAVRVLAAGLAPLMLIQLIGHFRTLPRWISRVAGGLAVVVPLSAVFVTDIQSVRIPGQLYLVAVSFWAVVALASETHRAVGGKRRRLGLATAGAMTMGLAIGLVALAPSLPQHLSRLALSGHRFSEGVALICFYFALATPRRLLTRWRRAEQSTYLSEAMTRDPEERGRRAPDDLFQAAARSVGGAVTFVALRDSPQGGDLRVTVASDRRLQGRTIAPAGGLFGRAMSSERPLAGAPAACEPDLGHTVLMHGGQVLVAPIVADATVWGVVVVAHRRGALFPEDDLEMLGQMARNAATALDHCQLIVERRQQERRAAELRLREIETRVDLMLESIKDYAMLVLESDGRVAAWHLGAEHVFGHPRAAIAGESAARIYDMSQAEFATWLQEAQLHGRAEREGTCRRADGSAFVGTTMIRPLVEEAGGKPGFVVVTHDVTDRRDLEERLRQGQKMEAIGQLAGGVAHDFNNLLTAILGYSDWLDRDLAGDPRRGQVTEIQKAAERAADLTRQLLAFSRRQELQPAAVDLSELAADLVPMLRRLIGEQIEIVDETPRGLPPVMADRSQIEQIILNLAVNARDAMPDGGRLTIRVDETWLEDGDPVISAGFPSGPYARLQVTDTGTGMDEDTRRRVFEPFFTTKEVGRGTGLGLSTVYGIVKQMGGAIDLETEPGHGTTFRLYFPQAAATAPAQPVEVPRRAPTAGDETVLLVEDDADVRTYLTRVLESEGYRVIAAEHARAALAATEASNARIDLVISGIVIPGSTGPEFVRLLGQQQPHVSALFISGHEEGVLARHTGAVGASSLLQKPFSSNDLLRKVRRILSAA